MANKKRRLIMILIIAVIILIVNIISIIHPVTEINKLTKIKECEKLRILQSINNDEYVTRIEFLESLSRCIGMTNSIIEHYQQSSIEGIVIDETANFDKFYYIFGDETEEVKDKISKYEDINNINERISKYDALCGIAADNQYLQVYENSDNHDFCDYEFRGINYITLHDAVVMIQACLSDIKTEDNVILHNSYTYNSLYLKAHVNGILLPCDSAYWSIMDTTLNRSDTAVLLNRLLHKKRYRYLASSEDAQDTAKIDKECSLTYYQYIK